MAQHSSIFVGITLRNFWNPTPLTGRCQFVTATEFIIARIIYGSLEYSPVGFRSPGLIGRPTLVPCYHPKLSAVIQTKLPAGRNPPSSLLPHSSWIATTMTMGPRKLPYLCFAITVLVVYHAPRWLFSAIQVWLYEERKGNWTFFRHIRVLMIRDVRNVFHK